MNQGFGWNSDDRGAGRYGVEKYSASANNRMLSYLNSRERDGTDSDMGKLTNDHATPQDNSRR